MAIARVNMNKSMTTSPMKKKGKGFKPCADCPSPKACMAKGKCKNAPKAFKKGGSCGSKTKAYKSGGSCGTKTKAYKSGGKVRGVGCAQRGATPCKVY